MLTLFFPGLGQLYNKDTRIGIIIMAVTVLLIVLPFIWIMAQLSPMITDPTNKDMVQSAVLEVTNRNRHVLSLFSFTFLGFVAYAITQAYFRAKEINEKEAPPKEEQ